MPGARCPRRSRAAHRRTKDSPDFTPGRWEAPYTARATTTSTSPTDGFTSQAAMRERDLCGMTEETVAPWRPNRRQKCPFAALLACGSQLISRAESVREAGGNPAVVCAKTDKKRSRFAGCFLRERGTRTRDLRRDRPVLLFPGLAGIGGDFLCEQEFLDLVLPGFAGAGGSVRRPLAGCTRDHTLPQ